MSKRTVYTIITPLPPTLSRETVLAALHDHALMIELNPLVLSHRPIKPPRFAPADEYYSPWYEITDRVHYIPGGVLSGKVVYHAVCHDLPWGLQTHCYAPMGVDIKGKWLLKGTLPGEPREPVELGVKVPLEGLYIREDIDMKVNFMMNKLVKKQLQDAHSKLLERLLVGANLMEAEVKSMRSDSVSSGSMRPPGSSYTRPDSSVTSYTVELPGNEHQEPVELPAGPGFITQTTTGPTPPAPPRYDTYSPYGHQPNASPPPHQNTNDMARLSSDSKTTAGIPNSSPPNISAHPYYAEQPPLVHSLDRSTSVTSSYSTDSYGGPPYHSQRPPSGTQFDQQRLSYGSQYVHPERSPSLQYRHPDASPTPQYARVQPETTTQYAQPLRSPGLPSQQPQLSPGLQQNKETAALQRFRESLQRQRTASG